MHRSKHGFSLIELIVVIGIVSLLAAVSLPVYSSAVNFYLDVNTGDQNSVLNKQAYFGGSNYAFADGSLRFMKSSDYSDSMWLVNQNYTIPGS